MLSRILFTVVSFRMHDLNITCFVPNALGRAMGKVTHWTVQVDRNAKWAPWSCNGEYIGSTPVVLTRNSQPMVFNGALMSYRFNPTGWNDNVRVSLSMSDPCPIYTNCTLFTNGDCTEWSEQEQDHGTLEIPAVAVS